MAAGTAVIDLCSDSDSDSGSDGFPKSPVYHGVKALPKPTVKAPLRREQKPRPDVRSRAPPAAPKPARVNSTSILDSLNPAQRRAVVSSANTVAILAGPGSGKTHTLTSRVVWLVDALGYRPQDVIVATFTVKAAREMKERIGKVLCDGRERRIVLGTFHSVARRYLATYGKRIGLSQKFSIIDDADSKAILTRIIKRLQVQLDAAGARSWISKKKSKGSLTEEEPAPKKPSFPSAVPRVDPVKNLEKVYGEYQAHLDQLNLLDYDDLLVKCADLLRLHPGCVANVQAVLIDEYQDTNGIQFELMKLFAQARNRITVVGDPDQSIYGWRSAEIKNLFRFLQDYPGTDEISLEENYRSSRSILDTSLQVIQQDQKRYQKSLLPVHKKGTRPVLRRLEDAHKEANWIVSEIRRAMLMCGKLLDHSDVAVLVRSAALSRPIEAALNKEGVPYRMIGGRKFFDRAEIKLLLDYLRVIYQPDNNEALSRVINVPRRGVGVNSLKSMLEQAECEKISLWTLVTGYLRGDRQVQVNLKNAEKRLNEGLLGLVNGIRANTDTGEETRDDQPRKKTFTLIQIIESILVRLNFRDYIEKTYAPEDEARWANVDEFKNLAREFMAKVGELEEEDQLPEVEGEEQEKETSVLGKFLATVSLVSDADKASEDDKKPMVTISTIHAAKGLEWPVVFIPAAYDGSLPHSRSEDTDEERRLLFVAMTRAKCLLNISYSVRSIHWRENDDQGRDNYEQDLSMFLCPVPSACFAEKGPSYDRGLLEEIGEILGRKVPSDSDIYKTLPIGSRLEDDQYPIDLDAAVRYRDEDEYGGRSGGGPRTKRRKTFEATGGIYAGSGAGAVSWQRGYSTTMESMPGFTTASAHQTALLAAEAAAAAADGAQAKASARERRAAVPASQQTITMSFGLTSAAASDCTQMPPKPSGFLAAHQPRAVVVPAGIPPELTNRRLGGIMPKIKAGHPSVTKTGSASNFSDQSRPDKRYAHFSSSPTRPDSTVFLHEPQAPPPPQPRFVPQTTRFHNHYVRPEPKDSGYGYAGRGKENHNITNEHAGVGTAAPATATRPAASLHNTSFAQANAGVAPLDKLRQPFKPPSVRRT
ncbi:ATP-dependent DNA helicase [Grosmannia clavigera kw1407]|uniref:DNA 3'-5' helicase n=1 Tax=Grosmannia clavigera (strain kw1407 / UAMH 11150) TaxID=655863 RepID=F0X9I1_GROCL|nr:ATP-dependent DNA helicase [Grosmannia clavigera kw1407]EFX05948.1 ATP-dependent DNA helicase [Grosmannia clavigera kw1407]